MNEEQKKTQREWLLCALSNLQNQGFHTNYTFNSSIEELKLEYHYVMVQKKQEIVKEILRVNPILLSLLKIPLNREVLLKLSYEKLCEYLEFCQKYIELLNFGLNTLNHVHEKYLNK